MDMVVYEVVYTPVGHLSESDLMIFPGSLFIEFFPKWEKVALFFLFFPSFLPISYFDFILFYTISDLYSISLFHIYNLYFSTPRF